MEWLLIYLLVMTEQIRDAAANYPGWIISGMVLTVVVAFCLAMYLSEADVTKDERNRIIKKARNWLFLFWLIPMTLAMVHTLLPTQKNMAIIVGTGITYSAVTSETGQRIGGKAVELLEKKINEALEDKPVGKEEKGQKEEAAPAKKSGSEASTQAT